MIVYLDTSSLVKLYVVEQGTDVVRALVDRATMVATSDVAYPEARAALARRRRERAVRPGAFRMAKETFEKEWATYFAVGVTALLCHEAGELAERYKLRGFDSIHLASFAAVARQSGIRDTRFSSFDDGLNRAARSLRRLLVSGRPPPRPPARRE